MEDNDIGYRFDFTKPVSENSVKYNLVLDRSSVIALGLLPNNNSLANYLWLSRNIVNTFISKYYILGAKLYIIRYS